MEKNGRIGKITADNIRVVNVTRDNQSVSVTFPPKRFPHPERVQFQLSDPVDSFTGRNDTLSKLHQVIEQSRLGDSAKAVERAVVLTGKEGAGKTETVRKYISLYKNNYEHVLWINAGNPLKISNSFHQVASRCQIPSEDIYGNTKQDKCFLQEVYDFLCKKRCLIVFDNADARQEGQQAVTKFHPRALKAGMEPPVIIITSRGGGWGKIPEITLLGMTIQESFDLIKTALKFPDSDGNIACGKVIAEHCEGLPGAMQEIIAIIQDRTHVSEMLGESAYSMSDFLKEFNINK